MDDSDTLSLALGRVLQIRSRSPSPRPGSSAIRVRQAVYSQRRVVTDGNSASTMNLTVGMFEVSSVQTGQGAASLTGARVLAIGGGASSSTQAITGGRETKFLIVMTAEKWHASDDTTCMRRSTFPLSEIQKKWDEGCRISVIGTTSGEYCLIWRKKTGNDQPQTLREFSDGGSDRIVAEFVDWVRIQKSKSKVVTHIGHNGSSLISVSEDLQSGERFSFYYYKGDFKSSTIDEAWKEEKQVLCLAHFNGWWFIQTSSRVDGQQAYVVSNGPPDRETLKKYWDQGFLIQTIVGGPKWVTLLLKTDSSAALLQSWTTSDSFPRDYMNGKWSEGMVVTSVTAY